MSSYSQQLAAILPLTPLKTTTTIYNLNNVSGHNAINGKSALNNASANTITMRHQTYGKPVC